MGHTWTLLFILIDVFMQDLIGLFDIVILQHHALHALLANMV